MDRYATGSPEIIVQRMNELLVPEFFGAVELTGTSPYYAACYSDSEKQNLVMQIPVGASSGSTQIFGAGGVAVFNGSGNYGIPNNAVFFVPRADVVVIAVPGTTANTLNTANTPVWLFAHDAKGDLVAIKYVSGSGAGFNLFRPGKQILVSASVTFFQSPQYITNAFCTILVPAFSVDTGYGEVIDGVYVLATANNFPREGVGVLEIDGDIYDILACWAIKRL